MNERMKAVLHVVSVSGFLFWILLSATAQETTNQTKSLTLHESIARALENNLEIKSQRINPIISTWGVVNAQSVYDPVLAGSAKYKDSITHQGPGLPASESREWTVPGDGPDLSLSGKLPTGASYDLSATDFRTSGNSGTNHPSGFSDFGSATLSVSQPLLKNFGLGVNSALIRVARVNRSVAIQNFVQFVMTKISDVSTAYYELVYAIENHKAALETRELARELLDENRQRAKIGTMSRLDVIQAESGVASSEQAVILTARTIKDSENTLKRLMCRQVDEFRGVSLLPVDYPVVHPIATDVDQSTRTAFLMRADYLSAKRSYDAQNILVGFNRNQMLPQLDVSGSYGLNGQSQGRFSDFIDSAASGHYPAWSAGVTVSFPLGNRQARANYHTAQLQAQQQGLSIKELEQDIIVQVDDAVGHVETNLKSVEAAQAALRLAQESLDAEKTKLLAGTSTTFLVLQAQSQLAASRSAEIRARADYSESLVALDLAEGTILQKNAVQLDEKF